MKRKARKSKRQLEDAVVRAAMEYYRWLVKKDFNRYSFIGTKGRWFAACTRLAARRRKK